MKRLGFLLLVAAALLCACGSFRSALAPSLPAIVERIIDEQLALVPARGREAGLHEYDSRLADYSATGIRRRIARLEAHRATLASERTSVVQDSHDVALLRWQIDEQLFWLTERRDWERDPAFYEELFSVNAYLDRPYAPEDERVRRLVEHEEAALLQVGHMRRNLRLPLAKALVDVAIQIYEGRAEYLRKDVAARVAAVRVPAELLRRFERANGALADDASAFAAWLRSAPTDESHALGPALFERLVEVYAGERISLAEFERMGEADLAENRALHDRLARVEESASPRPVDVLAAARMLVDDAHDFLQAHPLVTLPGQAKAAVKETPPFLRYNSAWLDTAGPFDLSLGGSFYITPPDPSWPEEQRAAYVPTLSELRSTTVHEVYPGHYVQAGFLRNAPTRAQKLVGSVTFIEGWAHYAEQMMVDEGFGGGRPDARLGMVKQALLRDCRYLVALGIHAKGLSLQDAEKRMMDDCHQIAPVARQQALRGAFHPWYFAYTLGKLQIRALRAEAQRAAGSKFRLQLFHDALLSHGQGPVGLVRQQVLADMGRLTYLPLPSASLF